MELVDRIEWLCKSHGLTFNQLEKAVGLKSTIARWKDHSPAIDKVMLVSHYFGITVSELLGETTPASSEADGLTEEEREIISLVRTLPDSAKTGFVSFLKTLGFQDGTQDGHSKT